MPLDARLDHVAVAVPDPGPARERWRALGAGAVAGGDDGVFTSEQWRLGGGGKVELLSPTPAAPDRGATFIGAFLRRFGAAVHHVTLKVPDLAEAVGTLRAAGLEVVDVDLSDEAWQEAFLRPSQVGGLVVQVATSPGTDEDWARRSGRTPEDPAPDAAVLHGPRLRDADLDVAAARWELLGAQVAREPAPDGEERLRCTWPDSPLDVVVEQAADGERPGPVDLRVAGVTLPADAAAGPAVSPLR